MRPLTITEFLKTEIANLDIDLTTYRTSLIACASKGAGYEDTAGVNLDYIHNAIAKQGIYKDLLVGLETGYITAKDEVESE